MSEAKYYLYGQEVPADEVEFVLHLPELLVVFEETEQKQQVKKDKPSGNSKKSSRPN